MQNEYARVFRALSDETRVRILEMLCQGEQCACQLLSGLEIGQSTLSHHMKILCQSGIVKGTRVGVWMYYAIDGEGCRHAGRLLNAVANKDMKRWLQAFRLVGLALRPFRPAAPRLDADPAYACCAPQSRGAEGEC